MRLLSWPGPKAAALGLLLATQGAAQTPVPPPNLDLSSLGRVALVGDFDAISVYSYEGQVEGFGTNGSSSILSQLPNGAFADLASTDASINAMVPFVLSDGTFVGVVVAGNFTSIGGVDATAIALFNATSNAITPLPGIHGTVSSLLCVPETDTVYVGGSFEAANSTNAIAWIGTTGWANLPFAGFNAPVTSITQAPNGHIIFGGSFSGLGNISTPTEAQSQTVNLVTASITSGGNATVPGNIVCTAELTNSWLLEDNTPGYWRADMQFGYIPSKLRLWNTNSGGRGTKTWRFTAHPINGIMNFTYTDPDTGTQAFCDATCPLSQNSSLPYQDFFFVNQVGMNSFQIDVSAWYGDGGGLDGIELFQDDIFTYAVDDFNEPSCTGVEFPSYVTTTGAWITMPSAQSVSEYLAATVTAADINSTSVVFEPDIREAGNYTVVVFTPGCEQDNTCLSRGMVTISATLTSNGAEAFSTVLYQTNNFDKYDQVYLGYVDASSSTFRPSVTLTPVAGQDNIDVVASRVRFGLIKSTGGLNGLFEYNPNLAVVDMDFSKSAINNAGTTLRPGANINALVTRNQTIYAAGEFSDDVFDNIMAFANNSATSLPGGGLNAAVAALYSLDDFLYVGGDFSNTNEATMSGLNNVAAYQYSENAWVSLGAGLDGPVETIVPLQLNVTANKPEMTIAFSGHFTQVMASGSTPASDAAGLAIWVPSHNNWLQNIDMSKQVLAGQLDAYAQVPNGPMLVAGTLASAGEAISGAVGLQSSSGVVDLQQLPINIEPSSSQASLRKRATSSQQDINRVVTGVYDTANGRNVTVLGGHFSATASDGSTIENLLFLDGSNNNTVTGTAPGLDSNSTFYALALQGDLLFAGGSVSGQVDGSAVGGFMIYDLQQASYRTPQPAALVGDNVVVNSIAAKPGSTQVYIAGSFQQTMQDLQCASICMYDTSTNQWNPVGTGLNGTIVALFWSSSTTLIAAGDLTMGANSSSSGVSASLATYDSKQQTWTALSIGSIPGPITAFAPAVSDASRMWVAGTAGNGSTFLMEIDGDNYRPVGNVFGNNTNIRGLQVIGLTKDHASSQYLENGQVLLVTGALTLPNFGAASSALFDGTTLTPFILASTADGKAGSISQLISSNTNLLEGPSKYTIH
jgi:Cortical protein marker for cell polarity